MTTTEHRELMRDLEYSCRHGGYILPMVKGLRRQYPSLDWPTLRLKLQVMAYYGGHPLATIEGHFNAGRVER